MESLFVSIPHSGEMVPDSVYWLRDLSEQVLMRDVDRYVDLLYRPALERHAIPHIVAECHRYVIDLNRLPEDYDEASVIGAPWPVGKHPKGLHWSVTTFGEKLMQNPMTMDLHIELVAKYYTPFHQQIVKLANNFKQAKDIFHLDLHSMPSVGTGMHNDPGEKRADIVVSDFHGKSSRKDFSELVISAYTGAGFQVAHNWPYFGGGITQIYGRPDTGHHTVQVELNRALYMDEESKEKSPEIFSETQRKLGLALDNVRVGLKSFA
jgi:N-formylglutamate amidohydrolase